MTVMCSERTDFVVEQHCGSTGMQVLEPSKVVHLTVDDNPLLYIQTTGLSTQDARHTISSTELCFATSSRVNVLSSLDMVAD